METRYRYDNGTTGTVVLVGALTPTGTGVDDDDSYSYRTRCGEQSNCSSRDGCIQSGSSCIEDPDYQLPIFHVQNIAGGGAWHNLAMMLRPFVSPMFNRMESSIFFGSWTTQEV